LLWKGYRSNKTVQLEVLFAEDLDQHTTQLEPEQRQWIDELFQSIRMVASSDPERADALFKRLANVNVGPVRTMIRGRSNIHGKANATETLIAALQRLEDN
jgi:hypothetical protein